MIKQIFLIIALYFQAHAASQPDLEALPHTNEESSYTTAHRIALALTEPTFQTAALAAHIVDLTTIAVNPQNSKDHALKKFDHITLASFTDIPFQKTSLLESLRFAKNFLLPQMRITVAIGYSQILQDVEDEKALRSLKRMPVKWGPNGLSDVSKLFSQDDDDTSQDLLPSDRSWGVIFFGKEQDYQGKPVLLKEAAESILGKHAQLHSVLIPNLEYTPDQGFSQVTHTTENKHERT